MDEIREFFKNDIRNPIAHEDWFIKDGWVWIRNKDEEKKQDMNEISTQIYNLFYFRVALSTYLLERYREFAKNNNMTSEQIIQFFGAKPEIEAFI